MKSQRTGLRRAKFCRGVCRAVLVAIASLTTSLAHANISCIGNVQYLAVSSNGSLYVGIGNFGTWSICSISHDDVWGGNNITAATCRGWYAGLLANKRSGEPVAMYLSNPPNTNCSTVGSWVTPTGHYHIDF
jgi:hypothetical protein